MVLKAKIGLFVLGIAGFGAAFAPPSSEVGVGAASSTNVGATSPAVVNNQAELGMSQARAAAERPFAAFGRSTMR
jgi:hypothetical protein